MKPRLLAALAATLLAGAADAAVVLSGASTASAFTAGDATVGLRYREFESIGRAGNDAEMFLGRNDLGVGANRVAANFIYASGANNFALALSGGTLTGTLNGNSLSIADIFGFAGAAPTQPFDTLQFAARDQAAGVGSFTLTAMMLSGTDYLGNAVSSAVPSLTGLDGGGLRYFTLTGIDFRQNFTLSGILDMTPGFPGSAELNRLDLTLGNGPIEQPSVGGVPEPATWLMLIAGFAFVGSTMRQRRGTTMRVTA